MAKATAAPTGEREWWQREYERECVRQQTEPNQEQAVAGFKRGLTPRAVVNASKGESR